MVRSPFWLRATHDVAYHAAGLANPFADEGPTIVNRRC